MEAKSDKCRQIGESLIDYADGCLDAETAEAVQAHLSGCRECRERLWALRRSLELARREWADRARNPAPRPRAVRAWLAGAAAAAAVMIALGLAMHRAWPAPHSPVAATGAITIEEMTVAAQSEEAAARLLFAAEQLASTPSLRGEANASKEYVRNQYANTAAGRSIQAGALREGVLR